MAKIMTIGEFEHNAVYEGLFNKILGNGKDNKGILEFVKTLVSNVVENSKELKKKYKPDEVAEHIIYDKESKSVRYDEKYAKDVELKDATCMPDSKKILDGILLDDVPTDNLSDKEIEKLKKRVIDETRLGALYVVLNAEKDDKCKEIFKGWKRDLEYLGHLGVWGYDRYVKGFVDKTDDKDIQYYKIYLSDGKNRNVTPYLRFNFNLTWLDNYMFYPMHSKDSAKECAKKLGSEAKIDHTKER